MESYPSCRFNLQSPEPNLDEAICKNVSNARMSDEAKKFFTGLMRANTEQRIDFADIAGDQWWFKMG